MSQAKRITPSVSSPSDDQDDIEMELRERSRLSPSPEVDLSTPEDRELVDVSDQPPAQAGTFDGRNSLDKAQWASNGQRARNRAPSPPLEADERGFTETANAVRARGMSLNNATMQSIDNAGLQVKSMEMEEMTVRRDPDLGLELFGQANNALAGTASAMMSSPMMQPREMHIHNEARRGGGLTNLDMSIKDVDMTTAWELRNPENVELDELDGLFSGF